MMVMVAVVMGLVGVGVVVPRVDGGLARLGGPSPLPLRSLPSWSWSKPAPPSSSLSSLGSPGSGSLSSPPSDTRVRRERSGQVRESTGE